MEWGVVLRWYLVLQVLSLPFIYISRTLFFALPDQGYAITKLLALLVVGLGSWVAFAWLRAPFGAALPWLVWLLCCALVWLRRRHEIRHHFRHGLDWPAGPPRIAIGMTELVFALVFVGWIWVVAHDAGIEHTEQPMDFMFMNSLWMTRDYPPADAWLAGFSISYYYLGYWMLVCLAKAAQVVPTLAYNVGQASWYALLWLGAWSIGYNACAIWRQHGQSKHQELKQGPNLAAGLLSGICVAGMGNLQGFWEWLYALGVGPNSWYTRLQIRNFPEMAARTGQWFVIHSDWWWWRSARVVSDQGPDGQHLEVITEFPMFSYILGDNHPHVLFAPFLFVAMTLALQLFAAPSLPDNARQWCKRLLRTHQKPGTTGTTMWYWHMGLALVLIGAAYFSNSWDLVSMLCLLPLSLSVGAWQQSTGRIRDGIRVLGVIVLVLLGGAAVLILPYLLVAQSQVQGIQLNWINPTRPVQLMVMWGALLVASSLFLTVFAQRRLLAARVAGVAVLFTWLVPALLLLAVWGSGRIWDTLTIMPTDEPNWSVLIRERWTQRLLTPGILGLLLGLGAVQLGSWLWWSRHRQGTSASHGFLLLCLTTGIGLIYIPEFVFLQDQFGALMRMNTVFKFHYQAWHLLAPVMALTVTLGFIRPRRWPTVGASTLLTVLLLTGLAYPLAAIGSKVQAPAIRTLDINRSLRVHNPAVVDALVWLRDRARPGDVIAEAVGQSYQADTSRVSGFTGMPTLLGWPGHERQWRGHTYAVMAADREEILTRLYATGTQEEILQTMVNWNIRYVYVGPRERQQYVISAERQQLLSSVLRPVYDRDGILILARPASMTDS